MRICVVGAGAVGGMIAVRLARIGVDVSVIARGRHLEAIRERGLTLRSSGDVMTARMPASGDPAAFGPQDYVILALKAPAANEMAERLKPLLGQDTAVITAQNGAPWWLFHRFGGHLQGRQIEAADPGGRLWRHVGPERAIGSVVYFSCEIVAPGVIRHIEDDKITLGEPDGSRSPRVLRLGEIFRQAGFRAPVRARIREEIWVKLLGNASLNPLSVLHHATLDVLLDDPARATGIRAIMVEVAAVGAALGIRAPISIDRRMAGARAVGAHKTSMLQDFEAGRPMETGAILGALQELGVLTGTLTPCLDDVMKRLIMGPRGAG